MSSEVLSPTRRARQRCHSGCEARLAQSRGSSGLGFFAYGGSGYSANTSFRSSRTGSNNESSGKDIFSTLTRMHSLSSCKRMSRHGTDLRYEKDRAALLRAMRERGVLAEICLTSEELILGLKSDENPFVAYRQAGVPVSLNTDDEGVLGSDLSHEFLRAARDYHLNYGDLKQLARNSIEYSFLPGHSLFRTREFKAWVPACPAAVDGKDLSWPAYRDRLATDCRAYLDNNPKAEAQARLEYQFQQFESSASLRRFQPRGGANEHQQLFPD